MTCRPDIAARRSWQIALAEKIALVEKYPAG
jgi:hypothetical protein